MIDYDGIAAALLDSDHLSLRSLVQDALEAEPTISEWQEPRLQDPLKLAALAAVTDLLAFNNKQASPKWTAAVPALQEPRHLLKSAATMKNLRHLCETESPEPLRRKGFLAPPNFLKFA